MGAERAIKVVRIDWKQKLVEKYITRFKPSIEAFTIAIKNEEVLLLGTGKALYKSIDRGKSFSVVVEKPVYSFARDPENPDKIWAGGKGQVLFSEDKGSSWLKIAGFDYVPSEE